MEFAARVEKALETLDKNVIAAEFEVAASTVVRWARGIAVPHPRQQIQIRKFIEQLESK